VLAYARVNKLNRVVQSSPDDRIGIVSAGKSWADTLQALEDLGLDGEALRTHGIRLAKVGLLCPSDAAFVHAFAQGLDSIVVVEEKRDFRAPSGRGHCGDQRARTSRQARCGRRSTLPRGGRHEMWGRLV